MVKAEVVKVLYRIEDHELHRLVQEAVTPQLDQWRTPKERAVRARRPHHPDVVIPARWVRHRPHVAFLMYVRGLATGRENFVGVDFQGLTIALMVHGNDPEYVKVKWMRKSCGRWERCYILPDDVLHQWGLVVVHGYLPGLAERVARKARAGA